MEVRSSQGSHCLQVIWWNLKISNKKLKRPGPGCRLPGRSTGYPALPPQTRTWSFPSYGSSVLILFTKLETNQATPRLAHNFATCKLSNIMDYFGKRQRGSFKNALKFIATYIAIPVASSEAAAPCFFCIFKEKTRGQVYVWPMSNLFSLISIFFIFILKLPCRLESWLINNKGQP